MAQKLHDTYGFSYDNLKVLLGGWNTWKEKNGTDPAGYPIATTTGATTPAAGQGSSNTDVKVVTSTVGLAPAPPAPAPANTPKP